MKVTGQDKIAASLQRIEANALTAVVEGLEDPAEALGAEIRRRAPADEGGLIRSVVVIRDDAGFHIGFRKPDGQHAHLVEYGHASAGKDGASGGIRIAPKPFIRPAVDATKRHLIPRTVKGAWSAIRRLIRR